MDNVHYIVCLTCYESKWADDEEVVDFVYEHAGHKIAIIPSDAFVIPESFDEAFKKIMLLCKMEEKTT